MAIFDPSAPQQTQTELMRQQVRAGIAGDELKDVRRERAMADALRQQNSQVGVLGQGATAAAPTILNAINKIWGNKIASQKSGEMDARSTALRGDVERGRLAQLQQAQGQRQEDITRQDQYRSDTRQHQMDIASQASTDRAAAKDAARYDLRENYQEWVDPETGRTILAATSKGAGLLDENGEPIKGASKYSRLKDTKHGSAVAQLGSSDRSKASKYYAQLDSLQDIRDAAKGLTDSDMKTLNKALSKVATKAFTPADLHTYIINNKLNLTPAAKAFLEGVNLASSRIRHELSGSAVTPFEAGFTNAFLPSATGLTVEDMMRRIGGLANDQSNLLGGMEKAYGMQAGHLVGRSGYQFEDAKEVVQAAGPISYDPGNKESITEAYNALIAAKQGGAQEAAAPAPPSRQEELDAMLSRHAAQRGGK